MPGDSHVHHLYDRTTQRFVSAQRRSLIPLKFGTAIAALGVVAPANQADKGISMLKWAILFFVISLIAGFFGFGKVESGAKSIAKVLFVVALLIFLVVLVFGVFLGTLVF